ncbi:hypothetical protein V1527DRAFT_472011 [Lipomyces starkeyi]
MTSQVSDVLSQFDGELLEIPDAPINQRPSSPSVATSRAATTKSRRYGGICKVWLHTPVGRNEDS